MPMGIAGLVSLFFSAFLAATILPGQSELVLAGMHFSGEYTVLLLVAVATVGNTLGSCINWVLGRYLTRFQERRWFPVKKPALERAERMYKRYGVWALLFAWVPLIGDALTVMAGFARTPALLFVALVGAGKAARYAAVIAALQSSV